MCWDIFILLLLPPTLPSQQIPSQRCWFLSCDHYGNLASFLLLIYDLVNMPACQMVLFFRLGDNEINKNCCKKQIGEFFFFFVFFFFPWMGFSSFLQMCLGGLCLSSLWFQAGEQNSVVLQWPPRSELFILCLEFCRKETGSRHHLLPNQFPPSALRLDPSPVVFA